MDDGWDFPVLGNPVALSIHLGVVMFWVIRFASIEDFELHVFEKRTRVEMASLKVYLGAGQNLRPSPRRERRLGGG